MSERESVPHGIPPRVAAQMVLAPPREAAWKRVAQNQRIRVHAAQLVLTVLVLGAWEILADGGYLDTDLYGSPSGVAAELRQIVGGGDLWEHVRATVQATVVGFVIGSVMGIVLGLVLGASRFLDGVFAPLVAILNSMPRIAFAPLLIVWFGLTMWAKVWVAVSLCVFILLLNTRAAARAVDRDLITLARINDLSWTDYFRKIVIPLSLPAIFAGLQLSVVYSFLGVIASEMIVAKDGLGTLVVFYSSTVLNVNALFGILLVIALLAALMTGAVQVAERRLLHWQSGHERR